MASSSPETSSNEYAYVEDTNGDSILDVYYGTDYSQAPHPIGQGSAPYGGDITAVPITVDQAQAQIEAKGAGQLINPKTSPLPWIVGALALALYLNAGPK